VAALSAPNPHPSALELARLREQQRQKDELVKLLDECGGEREAAEIRERLTRGD
jgi:hypothetical protein